MRRLVAVAAGCMLAFPAAAQAGKPVKAPIVRFAEAKESIELAPEPPHYIHNCWHPRTWGGKVKRWVVKCYGYYPDQWIVDDCPGDGRPCESHSMGADYLFRVQRWQFDDGELGTRVQLLRPATEF